MQEQEDQGPESTTRPRPAIPRRPGRWLGWLFSGIWLLYLGYPVSVLVTGPLETWQRVVGLDATVAFAGLYLVALNAGFRSGCAPARWHRLLPVALLAIAVGMIPLTGDEASTYFVFAGASVILLMPVRVSLSIAAPTIAFMTFLPRLLGTGGPAGTLAFIGLVTFALMYGLRHMQRQQAVIQRAEEDLAGLAVTAERERFSRDLHDIVGHSLTAIVVKAELAGKLAERDPLAVGAELKEIERLARESLQDVRRTVAGYREVTLAGELASARSVLAAAGIGAELPNAVDEVPGERRELFGWVVREGVTNVVRHSGAALCRIRVTSTSVEVSDDGRGGKPNGGNGGHGLTGLRERVAAAGGRVEAGPRAGGGFLLRVTTPPVAGATRPSGTPA